MPLAAPRIAAEFICKFAESENGCGGQAGHAAGVETDMANIDSGGTRRKRATNHELPLIPFIDFLLCLVTFLLATAGFANFARLSSNANVPGIKSDESALPTKRMHIDVKEHSFHVTWRTGQTVLVSNDIPAQAIIEARGVRRYPDLARFLDRDWHANGVHQDARDPALDEAVLHVQNSAAFEDVVGVLDALRAPQRALPGAKQASVFALSFAAD